MTTAPASPRLTLRQSLGRTHMMISLTAVCMAGLFLTITALLCGGALAFRLLPAPDNGKNSL